MLSFGSFGCRKAAEKLLQWRDDTSGSASDGASTVSPVGAETSPPGSARLGAYIECLNAVDNRVRTCMHNYEEWAPGRSVPSSGYPVLLSFPEAFVDKCVRSIRTLNASGAESALDKAALEYANISASLLPFLHESEVYFNSTHEFEDDHYAKAKRWHPEFQSKFKAFRTVSRALNEEVERANDAHLARQRDEVERTEGRRFRWHEMTLMASAKRLMHLLDEPVIDPPAFERAMSTLVADDEALNTYVKAHPDDVRDRSGWSWFESDKNEFIGAARAFARQVKAQKGKVRSRNELVDKYNDLVGRDNDMH